MYKSDIIQTLLGKEIEEIDKNRFKK